MKQIMRIRTGSSEENFLEVSCDGVYLLTEVDLELRWFLTDVDDRQLVTIWICRPGGAPIGIVRVMRDYIPLENLDDMSIEYRECESVPLS